MFWLLLILVCYWYFVGCTVTCDNIDCLIFFLECGFIRRGFGRKVGETGLLKDGACKEYDLSVGSLVGFRCALFQQKVFSPKLTSYGQSFRCRMTRLFAQCVFRHQRLRTSVVVSSLWFFLLKDFTLYGNCSYATKSKWLVVISCSVRVRLPWERCSGLIVLLLSRSVSQIQGSRTHPYQRFCLPLARSWLFSTRP